MSDCVFPFAEHPSRTEDRQIEENAYDRHGQSADGACRQREPERGLLAYQEGDEAQDSGDYGQEDGDDFHIPCFGVGT